ncbi:MAG: hypothetical protein A2144_15005 [Chloroflexi bacterium RBG_16_50_9]|nr:MAG: hypothetical protein A2144_15005 [Chloroflexi bacterium RBG_16_50_9]
MTVTEINARKSLSQFTGNLVGDHCCLAILRFFGAHPNSRFSELAIIHAVDENGSRARVRMALMQLADKGIIKADTENDTNLFLLTKEEPGRQLVIDLSRLDWRLWQLLLEPT